MASDGIPPAQSDYEWSRGSTIPDALSYEENGRTFQAYKQDKYFLPNDAMEQDRLDMTHQLFYQLLGYSLYKAPISHPGRVLDIATGTGIWAIQFAEQHPESTVIGTDLSLIQPPVNVSNVEFIRDDVEDNWVFDQPFDFVHMRLVFTCFKSHRDVINSVFANLNPGGVSLSFSDDTLQCRSMLHCLLHGLSVSRSANSAHTKLHLVSRTPRLYLRLEGRRRKHDRYFSAEVESSCPSGSCGLRTRL